VGQYVDPTCSILYPGDASVDEPDGAAGVDAGAELDATDGSSDADEDASG
jgi:hypothetical protein